MDTSIDIKDRTQERVPCPFCRELVIAGAIKCKHCGSSLAPLAEPGRQITQSPSTGDSKMDFIGSVKTCFSKYATFNGRASRSELWYFFLFCFVIGLIIQILIQDTTVYILWSLFITLPQLGVSARRLHDVNRSGWWFLLGFTVIGAIPLIYWWVILGDKGTNRFGAAPV
jgi:uncharacterized membrane protein YhaH (DUF805 family)